MVGYPNKSVEKIFVRPAEDFRDPATKLSDGAFGTFRIFR